MIRHLGWPALGLALVFSPVAFPSGDDKEQKGEASLVRPTGAPDADAKGEVEIEHHDNTYEEAFEVHAEDIDPAASFEVFLEDGPGSGNLVSIGFLTENVAGADDGDEDDDDDEEEEEEFSLEFDTEDGQALPFGVMFASELSGRSLEVRSGGQVYLEGVVPELGDGTTKDKTQSPLMRPTIPPDHDAKGKVELKAKGADLGFEVEADNLDPASLSFSVWLEDDVGSGLFQDIGGMTADEGLGVDEVKLDIETDDGESLPYGVTDLQELVGRALEVRGSDGEVYLAGTVPAFDGTKLDAKAKLSGAGKGALRVRRKAKTGAQEFKLTVKKQEKKALLEVWIEHPDSNVLELAATLQATKSGRASWKAKTKKGQALPHGVLSLDELGGCQVEIRDQGTGEVRLTGQVPPAN